MLGPTLLDFWRWSSSDLVSNSMRGVLAEFIVGTALGICTRPRAEWDAVDLTTSEGLRIEVKSAAYLQTWKNERPSTIRFGIRKTLGWTAETNEYGTELRRQADAYVFALLSHREAATLDPLDVAQWEFYVVVAAELDARFPNQKSIGLTGVRSLAGECVPYSGLAAKIRFIVAS